MHAKWLHVQFFVTPWTEPARLLCRGLSRQEHWSGLLCPLLPNPGIEPASLKSPALAGRFLPWCSHPASVAQVLTLVLRRGVWTVMFSLPWKWNNSERSIFYHNRFWQCPAYWNCPRYGGWKYTLHESLRFVFVFNLSILLFSFFKLEDNCFTMLCWFLPYNMNQP